jgi:hypothetical protein
MKKFFLLFAFVLSPAMQWRVAAVLVVKLHE